MHILFLFGFSCVLLLQSSLSAQTFDRGVLPFSIKYHNDRFNDFPGFVKNGDGFAVTSGMFREENMLYYGTDSVKGKTFTILMDTLGQVTRVIPLSIDTFRFMGSAGRYGSNLSSQPKYYNGKSYCSIRIDTIRATITLNGQTFTRPASTRQLVYLALDTLGNMSQPEFISYGISNAYNRTELHHNFHNGVQFLATTFKDSLVFSSMAQPILASQPSLCVMSRNSSSGQVNWLYNQPGSGTGDMGIYSIQTLANGNLIVHFWQLVNGNVGIISVVELNGTTGAEVWSTVLTDITNPVFRVFNGETFVSFNVTPQNQSFSFAGNTFNTSSNLPHTVIAKQVGSSWQIVNSSESKVVLYDMLQQPDGSLIVVGEVLGTPSMGTPSTVYFGGLQATAIGYSDIVIARVSNTGIVSDFNCYGGDQSYLSLLGLWVSYESAGAVVAHNGKYYSFGSFSNDVQFGNHSISDSIYPPNTSFAKESPFFTAFTYSALPKDTIRGIVYEDLNNNQVQDIGEYGLPGKIVKLNSQGTFTVTNSNGWYQFLVESGNHSVSVPQPGYLSFANPDTAWVSFASGGEVDSTANFGLHKPFFKDLTVTVSGASSINVANGNISIVYKNFGSDTASGQVGYIKPSNFVLSQVNPTPQAINGDTLLWSFTSLNPLASRHINIKGALPGTALGSYVFHTAWISPITGDTVPSNNFDTLAQLVTASYDPNNKIVKPYTGLSQPEVASGTYLYYTINFQNTGNDTAHVVELRDTLDTKLDVPTLEVLGATHPYSFSLNGTGNISFLFNNILLPDSVTNPAESQGSITFRIKPLASLLAGDTIYNTAYIYFDANPAVVTNTTATPITAQVRVTSISTNACVGDSLEIAYETSGIFGAGNSFSFLISDEEGSFDNTTTLGTVTGATSGQVLLPIPGSLSSGSNYKVRILASNPGTLSLPYITTLQINALPVVSISPVLPLCVSGSAVTLVASPVGGSFGGAANGSQFEPSQVGAGNHALYYTFTDSVGCTATDTAVVEVNALPVVGLSPVSPVCANGAVVSLTASPLGGNFSGATTSGQINPMQLGVGNYDVYYSYTDNNGCSAADTVTVQVNAIPSVTLSPVSALCANDAAVSLSATPAGGVFSGAVSSSQLDPAQVGEGAHEVFYSYTDNNGCSATDTATVEIAAVPLVSVDDLNVSANGTNTTFALPNHQPSGGIFSGPFANQFDISNPDSILATIADAGLYTLYYTYTSTDGCIGNDTSEISISFFTRVHGHVMAPDIKVYPNPANNYITISSTHKNMLFVLRDLSGKELLAQRLIDGSSIIDVRQLASGIYYYQIITEASIVTIGKLNKL